MPVQKIDMLIGAVLALGLVGSVIGTIVYEEAPPARTFDVAWSTSDATLPEQSDSQTGGGQTTFEFDVTRANLTEGVVTVVVSSSSARPQPRTVTVTVNAPNATEESESATLPSGTQNSVEIEVVVPLAAVPNATEVTAQDIDVARAQVNETYSTRNGTGTWTVTVEIQGEQIVLANPTYQISMTPTLSYYMGDVTIPTPEINR